MAYIQIDSDNRICSYSDKFHCGQGEINISQLPQNFAQKGPHNWKYVDGSFVYDAIEVEEATDKVATLQSTIAELQSTNDTLIECILQMSGIVYGE